MPFRLVYHEKIPSDLKKIGKPDRLRIANPIAGRLTESPERYGDPLRGVLAGYRKLRVGDHRVVFEIRGEEIVILAFGHRRDIYEDAARRR